MAIFSRSKADRQQARIPTGHNWTSITITAWGIVIYLLFLNWALERLLGY